MTIIKRPYKSLCDFLPVCSFLTSTYTLSELNSMMLPQYFEYAHTHPGFNHKLTHRMMLWEDNGNIVGFCGYEMDIGEAYLVCGKDYEALLCEMLFYAEQELSISNGAKRELRVSVIKSQASHLKLLASNGYECCSSEPIRIYNYSKGFPRLTLPQGFECRSLSLALLAYAAEHQCRTLPRQSG